MGIVSIGLLLLERPEEAVEEDAAVSSGLAVNGDEVVVIDARPWGEVTSLVDGEGRAIELPADRLTPLALGLPPGRYTVLLTHPELQGEERSCDFEVSAEGKASCNVELLALSPEAYWEDVGWWR